MPLLQVLEEEQINLIPKDIKEKKMHQSISITENKYNFTECGISKKKQGSQQVWKGKCPVELLSIYNCLDSNKIWQCESSTRNPIFYLKQYFLFEIEMAHSCYK